MQQKYRDIRVNLHLHFKIIVPEPQRDEDTPSADREEPAGTVSCDRFKRAYCSVEQLLENI